jgi:hypothetical protein
VEVAHEALLRQPPFSEWLEADREFLIGRQQLQNDLHDWQVAKAGDKKGALLTGLKLSRMRSRLADRPQDLTQEEQTLSKPASGRRTPINGAKSTSAASPCLLRSRRQWFWPIRQYGH